MILITPLLLSLCFAAEPPPDYEREVQQFRAHRQEEIGGENGWITLAGLFWLKPGDNRVGTSESDDVRLPASAPKITGVIHVKNNSAKFVPAAGVSTPPLVFKADDDKTAVVLGGVKFFLLKRDGKLAIRVRDRDAQARKEFTGLVWYPVDPAWRIEAKYTPWPKPRTMAFNTVAGVREQLKNPGYTTFTIHGQDLRLDPVIEDERLFFIIRDQTAGKTTYNAARFIYSEPPPGGFSQPGTVIIDFNKAMNPPCMFTPYATCPLPPQQNRLPIEVPAGEKIYGKGHDDTIRH